MGLVLAVDDDEGILGFIQDFLAEEGYRVREALNGAEALALITMEIPDLILLDMRMPVMDGWEFIENYRRMPGPHVPVVVMTAARDAGDIARKIGAVGHLDKPFSLDRLLEVVETYCQQS